MTDLDLDALLTVCTSLPEATITYPFGPELAVAKVRGKMFAFAPTDADVLWVTLKAAPGHAEALRRDHAEITPGWHMNKVHWVTARLDGTLSRTFVEDLVAESWDRVVAGLPAHDRPVVGTVAP